MNEEEEAYQQRYSPDGEYIEYQMEHPEMTESHPQPPTLDESIFEIEDYVGGNIEGIEHIDRMAFTVFLRETLQRREQVARNELLEALATYDWGSDDNNALIDPLVNEFIEGVIVSTPQSNTSQEG